MCDGYNDDWIILCSLFSILRSDVNINNDDLVSILSVIARYQINIVTQPGSRLVSEETLDYYSLGTGLHLSIA